MPPLDDPGKVSQDFYSDHAGRYAQISRLGIQSTYRESTHPRLMSDADLIERLKELVPAPARGLDVGCGAEARDVAHLYSCGYDVAGVDGVAEVIAAAVTIHPELAERLTVADVREPLPFPSRSLDFVVCNSVLQHVTPEAVEAIVLPSLAGLLAPSGVLLLAFKSGIGELSIYDRDFRATRSFILHDEVKIADWLSASGLNLIPRGKEFPGGLIRFRDGKGVPHVVGFWSKCE